MCLLHVEAIAAVAVWNHDRLAVVRTWVDKCHVEIFYGTRWNVSGTFENAVIPPISTILDSYL